MTEYFQVDPHSPEIEPLQRAAAILRQGGLVAFPTETVYGLGAAADLPESVERLKAVKVRPEDKPFSHLLPEAATARRLVQEIPPHAQALMNRYWPGPLTIVLPVVPGGEETVGLRVPAHAVALSLLREAGIPVIVPSANPSGSPPATTAEDVRRYFDGEIDAIIDGGPVALKEPSTVVRLGGERGFEILREGIITAEMIHQLVSGKTILFVCTGNTCRSPMAAALFRKHLARKLGRPADDLEEVGYRIASAGTFAAYGHRASEESEAAMREQDCDISGHISRPVTVDLLREADRVYAMTASQKAALSRLEPACASRIRLLADECVPDPIGGDLAAYRECAAAISAAVEKILSEL